MFLTGQAYIDTHPSECGCPSCYDDRNLIIDSLGRTARQARREREQADADSWYAEQVALMRERAPA